jgi:hypothetical protein
VWKTDVSNVFPEFARRWYTYDRRPNHQDDHTAHIGTFVLKRTSSSRLLRREPQTELSASRSRDPDCSADQAAARPFFHQKLHHQYLGQLENLLVVLFLCAVAHDTSCWTCLGDISALQDVDQKWQGSTAETILWYPSSFHFPNESTHQRSGQDRSIHLGVTVVHRSSCAVVRVAVRAAAQRATGEGLM